MIMHIFLVKFYEIIKNAIISHLIFLIELY